MKEGFFKANGIDHDLYTADRIYKILKKESIQIEDIKKDLIIALIFKDEKQANNRRHDLSQENGKYHKSNVFREL
jgi:hypothetical protein